MKKLLLIIFSFLFLVACSMENTPTKKVEAFLGDYNSLNEDVVSNLTETASTENLNDTNKENYIKAMKRQYQNMKYEIVNEIVDGNDATVSVKVTVYDLYKSLNDSNDYLLLYPTEFYTNGVYDENLFREHVIKEMNETTTTVDYTIDISLTKKEDTWIVNELDDITLSKLNGTYNYIG